MNQRQERSLTMLKCALSGLLAAVLFGGLLPSANATITPSQQPRLRGQSFVQAQAARFQGALLVAGYGGYRLRRVSTRQLKNDLERINFSIQKYTDLNAPHMPNMLGPVLLTIAGGIGLAVGSFVMALHILSLSRGFPFFSIILAAGGALLIAGLIWLIANIIKRRSTPYYPKLRKLKIIRKAFILELRNREGNSYGLRLPPVHGHQLAFAF